MRIPTNSNFSKEIAKKFKQIFHRDMTLGGLQDLQEQIDLINPVDTHLVNQMSQLRKEDEPKKNVSGSRATRQDSKYGKKFVESPLQVETEKKRFGF